MYRIPTPEAVEHILKAVTKSARWELSILGQGASSFAWLAKGTTDTLVVRAMPPHHSKPITYGVELSILQALNPRGLLVPAPIATSEPPNAVELEDVGFPWAVTRSVWGTPIGKHSLTVQAAEQLGKLLRALHDLPCTGYGWLRINEQGWYGEQSSALAGARERWAENALWPLDSSTLESHIVAQLAPDLLPALRDAQQRLIEAASEGIGAICHTDLHRGHLYMRGEFLTGLIDFGDVAILPPAWEFAILAVFYGWSSVREILRAYSEDAAQRQTILDQAQVLAVIVGLYKLNRALQWNMGQASLDDGIAFLREAVAAL
ncbi:MAG: aminoglycoside phosphotransferase family protein [Anaerolineae bacterium]|nr:aminoglycoside phosphotransferase family protein [Anaerolineae bacterium]